MAVSKRRRSDAKKESPLTREDATKAPAVSMLQSSEVSFPRGGASALTALERKEAANEAVSDVLFANEGEKQAKSKTEGERPSKRKKTKATTKPEDLVDKEIIPIEVLNFKNLIPGTQVLGQIQQVNKLDLVLVLPENLIGFVPITNISPQITKLLEAFEDSDEDESDNEDENVTNGNIKRKEFPDLSKLFRLGQWLRATVVEPVNQNQGKKQKKRIELSIEPSKVNQTLDEKEDLIPNTTLQATVVSVEDHGLILDIGKEGLSGFISNKELKTAGVNPETISAGTVVLTTIVSNKGRTVTLRLTTNKKNVSTSVSTVDSVVPGVLIDALVTEISENGVVAKAFGLVDASINMAHLAAFNENDIKHKYGAGSIVKARVLAVILSGGAKKLYLSALPHIINLQETAYDSESSSSPLDAFPIGHTIDSAVILGHDANYVYVKFAGDRFGQVHLSRVEGDRSSLATTFRAGTTHPARVLGYSQIDNYYILTLDKSVIGQKYLRPQDIPVGELITGEVLSVSSEQGLKIKIFDKYEAIVTPLHMSDVKLIYPERKFKIGSKVKGRIINISPYKGEIFVTLKKSLVGAESVICDIKDAKVGDRSVATVQKFNPSGAIVSFFGNVKAFLPKSEISETFVKKPEDHLRLGQTVSVRIVTVDESTRRVSVSCRLSQESSSAQKQALDSLIVGRSVIQVKVVEKTKDSVVVELPENNLRGVIFDGQLSDSSYDQNRALLKKLEVGSIIEGLVLDKDNRSRVFNLTAKKSLIEAAKNNELPIVFADIKISDEAIPGYVKSVTENGVFVGFGGKLVGLVLAKYATDRPVDDLRTVFTVNQSLSVKVQKIDQDNERFLLTFKEKDSSNEAAINPVDKSIKKIEDLTNGKITKALIKAVKQTQLNVQLADNIQGRVDISQVFDNFKEITDPRKPLSNFKKGDIIDVRVIGFHDARNHNFLPFSHRKSKENIVELSAKKSLLTNKAAKPLTIEELTVGQEYTGFINNSTKGFFFVTLSPSVKGVISFMNLSNNTALLSSLDESFPMGTALKVKVKSIDTEKKTVVLTARDQELTSFEDVKVGEKVPARVLKVSENSVFVELAENVRAMASRADALDDFNDQLGEIFSVNDIIPSVVLSIDEPNKRIAVSLKSEKSKDKLVKSAADLRVGDIVKGFVNNVTDKGIFVSLGAAVTGYVKVGDLSDSFLKDWKKFFKVNQQVTGKVSKVNSENNVALTLKDSEVNGELNILKNFDDLVVGETFEGSIRRVTEFGVFVNLGGTKNISGLCHKSEISDNDIHDLSALFGEGDRVKVKVLKIDTDKKKLSLGMKASYFAEDDVEMEDVSDEDAEDIEVDDSDEEVDVNTSDSDGSDIEDEIDDKSDEPLSSGLSGLGTNGFDWTASILDQVQGDDESSDDEDFTQRRKKKTTKKYVQDTTGDLKSKAPQSISDFERLIIGNPNSSIVWMNYMSFQLQLSEIEKAREIGERALKTIAYREEQEKLNIWIALLNLENTFGTSETLEEIFKRSTEYMDSLTMHQKLVSIYILSEKYDEADALFKTITKKFGKSSVTVWVSFGEYLLERQQNTKAHEVLGTALTALPKRDHVEIVRKFAQLEFQKGDPEQGRTLFEGLIADVPKRIDLWNVYIDQEIKKSEKKKAEELFERVLQRKITKKQAKFFFSKWLALEEKHNDEKGSNYVKAKAQQYVNGQ